jgi:hypothetical protein
MQLGHTSRAMASQSRIWGLLGIGSRGARTAAGGALGAPNHGRDRNGVRGAPRIILGMPLWPGTAHIVPLGPVGVEQGIGETVQEVGEVGCKRRSPTASSKHPNRGPCRDHDAVRSARLPSRLLHSLVGHRAERPGSMRDRPVALNLGKISRLRTAQSVVFLASEIRRSRRGGCDGAHIALAFVIED